MTTRVKPWVSSAAACAWPERLAGGAGGGAIHRCLRDPHLHRSARGDGDLGAVVEQHHPAERLVLGPALVEVDGARARAADLLDAAGGERLARAVAARDLAAARAAERVTASEDRADLLGAGGGDQEHVHPEDRQREAPHHLVAQHGQAVASGTAAETARSASARGRSSRWSKRWNRRR